MITASCWVNGEKSGAVKEYEAAMDSGRPLKEVPSAMAGDTRLINANGSSTVTSPQITWTGLPTTQPVYNYPSTGTVYVKSEPSPTVAQVIQTLAELVEKGKIGEATFAKVVEALRKG